MIVLESWVFFSFLAFCAMIGFYMGLIHQYNRDLKHLKSKYKIELVEK